METRWTSGCMRVPTHKISPHYLASSTNIFSDVFIRGLGSDLEVNREPLARELGFSAKHGTADELYSWCNSPGSTIFVLVSVLANLGRTDCVQKIEQYIHLQTMQLFVKVEEAATEQGPATEGPLFHKVITSSEFSLLQAMENVLGQDLVYFEIIGPGTWVTWGTSAKELKGQQLTLLRHSQPVRHTRAALCDASESDTELKQPVVTHNITAAADVTSNCETYVKTNPCTEMESLKYSIQASNSNNISLSGSLDLQQEMLHPFSTEAQSKIHSPLTFGSKNGQFTTDVQTHVKEVINEKQSAPEYAPAINHFPDKIPCKDSERNDSKQEKLIHQALDNVPFLSLLNEESSSLSPNIQSQPPSDGKNGKFTVEGQTQSKALIASTQNTSEYPQVIKHFPDKLLYRETESKSNNQDLLTFQRALENVPRLSLLEEEFASLIPNTERPVLPAKHEEKSDKMNNLNCGAPSSARTSMNPQQIHKKLEPPARPTAADLSSTLKQQTDSQGYNGLKDGDSVIPKTVLSQTYVTEMEMHHVVSSLFSQERQNPKINVPTILASHDFFIKAGFQPVGVQFQNITSPLENDNPLLCENSCLETTPPQKRHRLGCATPSFSIPTDQKTLLDVQALKLNQLQIQQQQQHQEQQQVPVPENDPASAPESQHHQLWSQQTQTQFHQNGQLHHHHVQQLNYCHDQNVPKEQTQSLFSAPQQLEHQTFHLVQQSQELTYLQQMHGQGSHQGTQPTDSTFMKTKPSSFMNSNASPYLLCHTPPPGFPEEQIDKNDHGVYQESSMPNTQSEVFEMAFTNQETNPPSHFVGKLGHVTKMNTKEYMTMSQPVGNHSRNLPVTSYNNFGQPIAVQNNEFSNTQFINHLVNFENCMRNNESRSDGSGISVDFPPLFHGEPSTFLFGNPNTFLTPQPFYPAPPIFDALGRRINTSALTSISQWPQDEHNSVPKRQLSGSKSLPITHCQTPGMNGLSQETELLQLDGYCQHENGDTIQHTMENFKSQDGNYIIWKSRRFKKLIISVSYLNQLFHFRVEEIKNENSDRTVYYLFEGGYKSESLLDLVKHYRQDGIRISMQSRGSSKIYIEHIYLRCPLKVKLEMKRKDTFRSK